VGSFDGLGDGCSDGDGVVLAMTKAYHCGSMRVCRKV